MLNISTTGWIVLVITGTLAFTLTYLLVWAAARPVPKKPLSDDEALDAVLSTYKGWGILHHNDNWDSDADVPIDYSVAMRQEPTEHQPTYWPGISKSFDVQHLLHCFNGIDCDHRHFALCSGVAVWTIDSWLLRSPEVTAQQLNDLPLCIHCQRHAHRGDSRL